VYVYRPVRGGWIERATVTAANGEGCLNTCGAGYNFIGGDYFGYSVALRGKTMAVGAPFASSPPAQDGIGPGAAYVFTGSGASWSPARELLPSSDLTQQDWFGYNVAISSNALVAVNAPYDNNYTGAGYVFTKGTNSWSAPGVKLVGNDVVAGDYFGYGVTTVGSYIVIGNPGYAGTPGVYFFSY